MFAVKQLKNMVDWFTDFNGMLTGLGLFYALMLVNHIHCKFLCSYFLRVFFSHSPIEYK